MPKKPANSKPPSHHPATHNLPHFQQIQYEFASWIRNPNTKITPQNIERRRMDIYRSLFLNNVASFLESAFPVSADVLAQKTWQPLVEAFFAEHLCHSPYFKEIPEEFMAWLSTAPKIAEDLPEWVPELLHYEWLELYISTQDGNWPEKAKKPKTLADPVTFSPFFEMAAYRYPVQTISKENIPQKAPETPTFLAVYRTPKHEIRFVTLAPQTALLIEFLRSDAALTPEKAATMVENATHQPFAVAQLKAAVKDLRKRSILF